MLASLSEGQTFAEKPQSGSRIIILEAEPDCRAGSSIDNANYPANAGIQELFSAQATLVGNELIRMIRKAQMRCQVSMSKTCAEVFNGLAG